MNARETLLIIEEDLSLQRVFHRALLLYALLFAEDADEGLKMTRLHHPDLILVSLEHSESLHMLALCRQLRECGSVPIIVLTAEEGPRPAVDALLAGADDYMRLPFAAAELRARVEARLRRPSLQDGWGTGSTGIPSLLRSGDGYLSLQVEQRVLYAGGQEVHLSKTEYALLYLLMFHAGKVLTHHFLLQNVWGPGYRQEVDYLRVFVHHLRQKIEVGSPHRYISTESGVGYVFRLLRLQAISHPQWEDGKVGV